MAIITASILVDIFIAAVIGLCGVYKYFTKNFDYWKNRNVDYVKPIPFFGNFQDVITLKVGLGYLVSKLYKQTTKDFLGLWVFGKPILIVRNPEFIKHILIKDFNYFNNRTLACDKSVDPIGSHTLFLARDMDWRRMRNKLSPLFTSGKLRSMIPLIECTTDEMRSYITERNGQILDMKEIAGKFTTDVFVSCCFGLEGNSFSDENAIFRRVTRKLYTYRAANLMRVNTYFFSHFLVKALKITFFHPLIYKFCRNVFNNTIKQREISLQQRNDVIDLIIDMKKYQSLDDIKIEGDVAVALAMQFLAAGFETVSTTIAFALYELCNQKDLQTKLRKEILECKEMNGEFTYESIQSMKYLDKVVKETLRKYPALPFLDRRCSKDYKFAGTDFVLEKGTAVYIPVIGMHNDPKYFPDPKRFDPERFTPENVASRPPYVYLPFGEGPHNCIGEVFGLIVSKLGIVNIISQFMLERCEETDSPLELDRRPFLLQPKNGLNMKVTVLQ